MVKHTNKEEVSQTKSWRLSLSLIGGLVFLIGGALLVWSLFLRPPTRPSAPSVQYSLPQPPLALSVAYEDAVKRSLAQQLHMSASQLAHETQANQDGLFGVADTRGLSEAQLDTLLLNAFQSASDQMERLGHWTSQQASAEMHYWKQREGKMLVGDVSNFLRR